MLATVFYKTFVKKYANNNLYWTLSNLKLLNKVDLGYLPFICENRKFRLENQIVRAIPFGTLQIT